MKNLRRLSRVLLASVLSTALVFGAATVVTPPAQALGPITILCGPSFQWSCARIGGPSLRFLGTICDKNRFERRSGYICSMIKG